MQVDIRASNCVYGLMGNSFRQQYVDILLARILAELEICIVAKQILQITVSLSLTKFGYTSGRELNFLHYIH
jgi:hypothetical protein